MSYVYKFILIFTFICLSKSDIEYSSCIDNKRNVKLEDGSIKSFDCIQCDIGLYTKYENGKLICVKCPENSNNYGHDIVIDTFTEKILSRYSPVFDIVCGVKDKEKNLCPKWEKNIFSLRVNNIKDNISSKSIIKLNKYYVENGEFQIKYINYNGDINRYLLIYINNVLVFRDDTRHSKEKIIKFKIEKGHNEIILQYIIENNLSPKENINIESFFAIYEIKMINAETSSLECQKYDSINILKNTILNNCNYYVNKCTENDICTYRFLNERSEGSNIEYGSQIISYNKIEAGNCKELIIPPNIEIEAEECSYGQYINLRESEENVYTCEHCPENTYNNKTINYDFTCDNDCNIKEKEFKKIFYINNFEDHSQFDYHISINENIGYVEINYEKFNVKENSIIFVEIDNNKNNINKTYRLINPNEKTDINEDNFLFTIPFLKGQYELHLKGKNLKIKKIKIINSEEGGNYLCIDKLNPEEEIICPKDKYYSPNKKICLECQAFSIMGENAKCDFIEEILNDKFNLQNSLLLKNELLSNDYFIEGKNNNKYHLNLNPTFPLIYEIYSNSNFKIIGNELNMIKIIRGINNRGIIVSYFHEEDESRYVSHLYIKCYKSESKENIEFINKTNFNNENHYYFMVQSNLSCPFCLNSEVNEIKTDGICHQNNSELYNIEIKESSMCVIKPYENVSSSLIINDTSQFLLYYNSSSIEDQNLIFNYKINENIPIFYEKEEDEIITKTQIYKQCKNETEEPEKNDEEAFHVAYIILIVIGSLIIIAVIMFLIWKIKLSKNKIDKDSILNGDGEQDLNLKSGASEAY